MDTKLQKEVWSFFKRTQPVYLATSAYLQSHVRPVTLIFFRDKFWIATGSDDAKISQIKENSNIEFCLPLTNEKNMGYIRAAGVAEIVEDINDKKMIMENISFIKDFWQDATDPGYDLLSVQIHRIEYLPLGEMLAKKFLIKKDESKLLHSSKNS